MQALLIFNSIFMRNIMIEMLYTMRYNNINLVRITNRKVEVANEKNILSWNL